jgi:outer membrane protein assembly factor BamD (BamD/ComL family)
VEALKDFRAVADTHASSSVADDALLEIARYYFEVAEDFPQASTAVDEILKKYATSNSAPDAYVIAGRLALAKSHQPVDLDAAIANFDRVTRLFPSSNAVPNALEKLGEASYWGGKLDESLSYLGRVESEYPTTVAASDAYLAESRVLVARGDATAAMEELQQVRNRWPGSPEAATALAQTTVLYRLYVRAHGGSAYALAPDTVGPPKIENFVDMALTPKGALYLATETGVTAVQPADAPKPPPVTRPRALVVDASGSIGVLEQAMVHPAVGEGFSLPVMRNGVLEALNKAMSVGQLSNGDWIVADESDKFLQRYTKAGKYLNVFSTSRLSRFVVNGSDEVIGFDRDQKAVTILDITGKAIGHIPFKGTGYELQAPEDLAFDGFGHLYVLDHTAVAIFSPFAVAPAGAAPGTKPAAAPSADRASYHLLTLYTEADKSPSAFHKATGFAIDRAGTMYLYDDRAQRILVYR